MLFGRCIPPLASTCTLIIYKFSKAKSNHVWVSEILSSKCTHSCINDTPSTALHSSGLRVWLGWQGTHVLT